MNAPTHTSLLVRSFLAKQNTITATVFSGFNPLRHFPVLETQKNKEKTVNKCSIIVVVPNFCTVFLFRLRGMLKK